MFRDRVDAGRQLAESLKSLSTSDSVVMALPRGGAVIGEEVAREFGLPLGLVLVRKISHPFYPEVAMGAVVDNEPAVYGNTHLSPIDRTWRHKAEENARKLNVYRRQLYYGNEYSEPDIEGKTAIIVDDGIATGLTMAASVRAIREKQPKQIIAAVPVASSEAVQQLQGMADEVVVLYDPAHFKGSVGAHYLKFDQVSDEEVRRTLRVVQDSNRQFVAAM